MAEAEGGKRRCRCAKHQTFFKLWWRPWADSPKLHAEEFHLAMEVTHDSDEDPLVAAGLAVAQVKRHHHWREASLDWSEASLDTSNIARQFLMIGQQCFRPFGVQPICQQNCFLCLLRLCMFVCVFSHDSNGLLRYFCFDICCRGAILMWVDT